MNVEVKNHKSVYYPPGGILIWIIIFLELLTFGAVLITMGVSAKEEAAIFHQSRLQLNVFYGTINTIFLLTSGYGMAMAVQYFKEENFDKSRIYMIGAMIGGALFLIMKTLEYSEKISAGLTMGVNSFWNFYWMLTLFHVVHVIVGLVILGFLLAGLRKKNNENMLEDLTAGAAFWHMCDLIWLLLFPVLYLVF